MDDGWLAPCQRVKELGRKGSLRSLGIGGSEGNKGRLTEIGSGLIIEFGFLSLK